MWFWASLGKVQKDALDLIGLYFIGPLLLFAGPYASLIWKTKPLSPPGSRVGGVGSKASRPSNGPPEALLLPSSMRRDLD